MSGGVADSEETRRRNTRRTTSVYLPLSTIDELDDIADMMDRSRTWVIEQAVNEWLERHRREYE